MSDSKHRNRHFMDKGERNSKKTFGRSSNSKVKNFNEDSLDRFDWRQELKRVEAEEEHR
jgi:hypothetical protein